MASLFDIFPAEIVNEITTWTVLAWDIPRARWSQMCLLSAVCRKLRAIYSTRGSYSNVDVMTTLIRDIKYLDLWRTMYQCGARINPVATLNRALSIQELDDIVDPVASKYELSYHDLDELRATICTYPERLVRIWRCQNVPVDYFEARFDRFRNVVLYREIARVMPNAPYTIDEMIAKGIPSAIPAYYPNRNLSLIPFTYVIKSSFSTGLLAKFMAVCGVAIGCTKLTRLIESVAIDKAFYRQSNFEDIRISVFKQLITDITQYIVCEGCPANNCLNRVIINSFALTAVNSESLNIKKARYYVRVALPIRDVVLSHKQLIDSILQNDDMFTLKYLYDCGVFTPQFIKDRITAFLRTRHCQRWLIAKGIIVN